MALTSQIDWTKNKLPLISKDCGDCFICWPAADGSNLIQTKQERINGNEFMMSKSIRFYNCCAVTGLITGNMAHCWSSITSLDSRNNDINLNDSNLQRWRWNIRFRVAIFCNWHRMFMPQIRDECRWNISTGKIWISSYSPSRPLSNATFGVQQRVIWPVITLPNGINYKKLII